MSLPKSHGHSLGKERGQGTARRGRVVALSQRLDPAVTARNPPAALPGAFMHFPAVAEALGAAAHRGNRADAASGSWGREGRGKKTFPLPRQPDAVDPRVDNDSEPAALAHPCQPGRASVSPPSLTWCSWPRGAGEVPELSS